NLVGEVEDRGRDGEAERLGGREINHQLEPGRLLDRKIGRLGAVEDLSSVITEATPRAGAGGAINDQATSPDEFAPFVPRRHRVAGCQRHQLLAPARKEWVVTDEEGAGLRWGGERGVDLAFAASLENLELHPLRARRFLHLSYHALGTRVREQGNHPGS